MSRKRRTKFGDSVAKDFIQYNQYFNRYKALSMAMFKWDNVPETIDTRYLELTLFERGQAVAFLDEVLGLIVLPVSTAGKLDVYNNPIIRRAYANNGYQRNLDESNSVIIYNNMERTNTMNDIYNFALRLNNLDSTIDVNINAQKTPILIKCAEEQRLTMVNLYKQYEGNEPFIFGEKNLDMNGMTVLKTDAPFLANQLWDLKNQIWNEGLTYLGISNISYQKKERLISDEVIRSQGGAVACRYSRLYERQIACERINSMFGTNMSVEYRDDFQNLVEKENIEDEESGEDDE